ncbi:MAG: tetratricopeptide repeat protein, partial [bacterium]
MLSRRSLLSLLLALLFFSPACAENHPLAEHISAPTYTLPQLLTADLSSESDPKISPDGKWLLYTSDRSGNYDLWIRAVSGGIPVQLTTHPANDYHPSWSPDGKKICFVSNRNDPYGSIFIAKIALNRETPRFYPAQIIIEEKGKQDHPSFSNDGRCLVYQDSSTAGVRLCLFDLKRKTKQIITEVGYLHPEWNPKHDTILCLRFDAAESREEICILRVDLKTRIVLDVAIVHDGLFPLAFPTWAPDGSSFVVAMINQDQNGDGLLTIKDGYSLVRFDLEDSTYAYRVLSIGLASESHPCWAEDGYLYFVSDLQGNSDLWRMPDQGPIPDAHSAEEMYSFARSIGAKSEITGEPLSKRDLFLRLLALDRVRSDFPQDRRFGALALLASARLWQVLGSTQKTEAALKRISRFYSDQEELCAEAEIDFQMLVHQTTLGDDGKLTCENPISLVSNLKSTISRFPNQVIPAARATFLIGAAYQYIGALDAALDSYKAVLDLYPQADSYPAEALLNVAEIYSQLGNGDEALRVYLDVISQFPEHREPTKRAIQRILDMKASSGDAIAGLQDLIGKYSHVKPLIAAAQIRIANLLAERGETDQALFEYEWFFKYATRDDDPLTRSILAEAMISAAIIQEKNGDFQVAQENLKTVEAEFADLQNGTWSQRARNLRIELLTKRAQSLYDSGDFTAARLHFEAALQINPMDLSL